MADPQSELLCNRRKTFDGYRAGISFTPQRQGQVQKAAILLFTRHDQAHQHRMLQSPRQRLVAAVGFAHHHAGAQLSFGMMGSPGTELEFAL